MLLIKSSILILFLILSCNKIVTKKVWTGCFPATKEETSIKRTAEFHMVMFEREGWICDSFAIKDTIDSLTYRVDFYLRK